MKDIAAFFSHDSNARNDEKILSLRMKLGWEGYGLFWALIEKLRDSSEYMCVKDYNLIAFDLRTDASKIKSIVEEFGLFSFTDDGKRIYSESLLKRMEYKQLVSDKRRTSIQKRWNKNEGENEENTNVIQNEYKCNTNVIQKDTKETKRNETKRKEKKEGEPPTPFEAKTDFPPKLETVIAFANEHNIPDDHAKNFYLYYKSQDWYKGGQSNRKLTDWQARLIQWTEEENKRQIDKSLQAENGNIRQGDKKVTYNSRLEYRHDPKQFERDVEIFSEFEQQLNQRT